MIQQHSQNKYLLYYDGACFLCTSWMKWVMKRDVHQRIQGLPLQLNSELAASKTVVFQINDSRYYKSTAILKLLLSLGSQWRWVAIGYIVPRFIRDYIYDKVAAYRLRFNNKEASCNISQQLPLISEAQHAASIKGNTSF